MFLGKCESLVRYALAGVSAIASFVAVSAAESSVDEVAMPARAVGAACELAGDSVVMCGEADAFLAGLPAGAQRTQCRAVREAIGGDYAALERVRVSRSASAALSEGVSACDFMIHGADGRQVPARLFRKAGSRGPMPLLVYLHGGGWAFGSINSCSRFCDALAATGSAAVLAVDYALAPEHTYPAGLADCVAAVEYAAAHSAELDIDPEAVSVGGDSAGGNLALAAALYLGDNGGERPRSLVLFYPVSRAASDTTASWRRYGEGYGLDAALMDAFNDAYVARGIPDGHTEYVSPIAASADQLRRLPEILMVSAERDILADQGREFADRVSSAGGQVRRVVLPGTTHLFITVAGQTAAFDASVALTAGFLRGLCW